MLAVVAYHEPAATLVVKVNVCDQLCRQIIQIRLLYVCGLMLVRSQTLLLSGGCYTDVTLSN